MVHKAAGALTLSVQANAWEARPEGFEGAFLPLRVIVRNSGPEAVTLRAQDQMLEDDRGGRWQASPPDDVVQQFAERAREIRRPTVSVRATGPAPTTWSLGLGIRGEGGWRRLHVTLQWTGGGHGQGHLSFAFAASPWP